MANTYEAITTVTVGSGGAANIEFTSIPATYTDLVLKVSMRTDRVSATDPILITFNNNGANYSYRSIWTDGSGTVYSFNGSAQAYLQGQYATAATATVNTFTNFEMYIPNYAGSANKSASSDSTHENNATQAYLVMMANLWADSSAITSIKFDPDNGNFVQYSTATLYGIKNS